jgi:hypothetical protein
MTTINSTVTVSSSGGTSSTPDPIIVTQSDTTLVFTLDSASAQNWKIVGLTSTDEKDQLGPVFVARGGVSASVLDSNSENENFNITILVHHRTTGQQIGIDPAVQNDPRV